MSRPRGVFRKEEIRKMFQGKQIRLNFRDEEKLQK
jgi:hypothetical protein